MLELPTKPDVKPCQYVGMEHLCKLAKTEYRCPFHPEPRADLNEKFLAVVESSKLLRRQS